MINVPIQLTKQLEIQEGLRLSAYWDNIGNVWTIGYGHTGSDVYSGLTITQEQAQSFLDADIRVAASDLEKHLPWTSNLTIIRKCALVNQTFNMGIGGVLEFHEELSAIQDEDWEETVLAMRESLWYRQVPNRVNAIAYQLYYNEWASGYLTVEQTDKLNASI